MTYYFAECHDWQRKLPIDTVSPSSENSATQEEGGLALGLAPKQDRRPNPASKCCPNTGVAIYDAGADVARAVRGEGVATARTIVGKQRGAGASLGRCAGGLNSGGLCDQSLMSWRLWWAWGSR